jgi:hypothetical protein
LLADNNATLLADNFGRITLQHNGGSHIVSNLLTIVGGASSGSSPQPATYQLNGGTLFASNIVLNGIQGDAYFYQSNGVAQARQIHASNGGPFTFFTTEMRLAGGTLNAGNLSVNDGGTFRHFAGALAVTNTLDITGFRGSGIRTYSQYTFLGGTLIASNINMDGDWIIGDGSNRISNPGTIRLSQSIQTGDAVEQLGRFILGTNATISLGGNAARLSFANSSSEAWTGGATLVVLNWNGSLTGGGSEYLRFGTSQSGLTPAQLSQIRFQIGNPAQLYSAKFLSTGEVVPDQPLGASLAFSRQGSNLQLTWPSGWALQSATNVAGPYADVPGATSPYNASFTDPRRFFRLRGLP